MYLKSLESELVIKETSAGGTKDFKDSCDMVAEEFCNEMDVDKEEEGKDKTMQLMVQAEANGLMHLSV